MPKFIWLTHVVSTSTTRPMLVNLDALAFVFPGDHGGAVVGTDGGSYLVVETMTDIAKILLDYTINQPT